MMTIPPADWRALIDAAAEPYRRAGRFAWHFARGKLGRDPVFRHLLAEGLIPPQARVLDIGCGQGLLASLLRSSALLHRQGRWPQGWAPAPVAARVTGIELMARDVERAQAALAAALDTAAAADVAVTGNAQAMTDAADAADASDAEERAAVRFICGDMRHVPFPPVDAVVILDVLHYISVPEQDVVLQRVRDALPAGGRLLLRVGDAASRRGFVVSQWVDKVVTLVRGHRVTPQFGRPLECWIARLESLGFEVRSRPMSQGTPFANVLLIGNLRGAARHSARAA